MLEVGANSEDLVDQILHADNAVLAEVLLNDRVIGESNALLVDLPVPTLVNELADGLQVGVSVGDPWLDNLQHLEGSLGHANEDTIVDLEKTEELEDLAGLWCNLIDTRRCKRSPSGGILRCLPLDTDNEDQLVFIRNVEIALLLSKTLQTDLLPLLVTVLLNVFLGTLEDNTTLLLCGL